MHDLFGIRGIVASQKEDVYIFWENKILLANEQINDPISFSQQLALSVMTCVQI